MPSSVLRKLNLSLLSGLVNKSTNYFLETTNWTSQSPLLTWSLIKWWRISICLVLECYTGFFVKFIALVLSQRKRILDRFIPKSLSCCLIQRLCAQQLPASIYSASVVNNVEQVCFLLCHKLNSIQVSGKFQMCSSYPIFNLQNQSRNSQLSTRISHLDTIVQLLQSLWDTLGFAWLPCSVSL